MTSTCGSILTPKDIINGFTSQSLATRTFSARRSSSTLSISPKALLSTRRECVSVLARDQPITVGVRAEMIFSTRISIRSDKV